MKEIKAIIKPFMLQEVLDAPTTLDELPGLTVSHVIGWGKSRGANVKDPVHEGGHSFAKKIKLEIVVPDEDAPSVEQAIAVAAQTGRPGDGKIFVYDVRRVLKIRTGETGARAV